MSQQYCSLGERQRDDKAISEKLYESHRESNGLIVKGDKMEYIPFLIVSRRNINYVLGQHIETEVLHFKCLGSIVTQKNDINDVVSSRD